MGRKRRSFNFTNGLNGVNRFYYPYRSTPPELNGSRFMDISSESISQGLMYSDTDPDGSYTGVPRDENEVPVQDADDL